MLEVVKSRIGTLVRKWPSTDERRAGRRRKGATMRMAKRGMRRWRRAVKGMMGGIGGNGCGVKEKGTLGDMNLSGDPKLVS